MGISCRHAFRTLQISCLVLVSIIHIIGVAYADTGAVQVALASVEADPLQPEGDDSKELKDLLAWAIENSDPEELRRQAQSGSQDAAEFAERKAKVQQLMAEMKKEPSEQELMQEALGVAKNTSEPLAQREAALTALRYLVEPIDNANYLPGMGGLPVLLDIVEGAPEAELKAAAQYVLGTAASNNLQFQAQALQSSRAVAALLQNARSTTGVVSEKALYALSSLISSNHEGHLQFYASGGVAAVKHLLESGPSHSQLRKLLSLITDLTDVQGEVEGQESFADEGLVRSLLALLRHPDLDVRERSLLALISLASHPGPRSKIRLAGGQKAVGTAEEVARMVMQDADSDHRELLQHFLVLLSDLNDVLAPNDIDRTEL